MEEEQEKVAVEEEAEEQEGEEEEEEDYDEKYDKDDEDWEEEDAKQRDGEVGTKTWPKRRFCGVKLFYAEKRRYATEFYCSNKENHRWVTSFPVAYILKYLIFQEILVHKSLSSKRLTAPALARCRETPPESPRLLSPLSSPPP